MEVEAALLSHPAVQAAAVVAVGDALIGYVVPSAMPPSESALLGHLAARLPEYMVPSAIVVLDALPLTRNGKLDRAALPQPAPRARAEVLPRTDTEARIAEIWTQLLHLLRVGVNDDFFSVGGHSLLAMQLATRLAKTFAVPMKTRRIFEHPTVAAQAALVEQLLREGAA
jgi:hypothetical protein